MSAIFFCFEDGEGKRGEAGEDGVLFQKKEAVVVMAGY
jgi:hypothetical protein